MLLGKRPRPPMRRTTSLTEFSFDVGPTENSPQPPGQEATPPPPRQQRPGPAAASPPPTVEAVAVMSSHGGSKGGVWRPQQKQQQQNPLHHYQYQHQGPSDGLDTRYLLSIVSPRNHRRNSGDFAATETAHFLRACGLCKRRLGPGRDTFMYRGEVAFCSLECRQQQMNQDERKEKCSLPSMKKDPPPQSAAAAGSEASGNGETAAAA